MHWGVVQIFLQRAPPLALRGEVSNVVFVWLQGVMQPATYLEPHRALSEHLLVDAIHPPETLSTFSD